MPMLMLFVFPGAIAQITDTVYDISEVTITAYNSPEKLMSVPGGVSLIQTGTIQRAGYNIVSSLSRSPGVFIQEATPGTMKVTLRGIGSRYPYGTRKIKMFFDGIPLYSAEGETYFDEINPDYISRMEILRGPASSIYGASLGGAIVLYPGRIEAGTRQLSLMSSVGSFGYNKNTLTYASGGFSDDLLISLSRVQTEGYRNNSNYLRHSFMLNYRKTFTEKLSGDLLITGSLVNTQLPSSIDSAAFISDPRAAAPLWLKTNGKKMPKRILAGYKLNYRPSENWDIIGSVYFTFRGNEENRPFNFLDESGASYGGRVLARYYRNTGHLTWSFTTGANLFFETYDNTISENPGGLGIKGEMQQKGTESINQSDLFSQLELKYSDFSLTAGFDINKSGFLFTDRYSADTVDQSGLYNFDPVFSPRLSLAWNPTRNATAYIALNHGFTIPSLSETLTPLGLINRNIKPEKAWSYESGVRFNLFGNRSFIDLALYYMKVSDLIVPKRVAEDFYVGMNAGESLHQGIEIMVRQWLWGKREGDGKAPVSAILNLACTFNRFKFLDFIEDDNDFSGNKLPGMPDRYLNASIDLNTAIGIYSQVDLMSSGKIPLNDFNSRFAEPWTVLNAATGYTFSLKGRWIFDAMFRVANITNTRYASMVVVNAPGSVTNPPRYFYPGLPASFSINLGLKYSLK
jgi:iron complex outermembrane receptor protein